MKVDLFIKAALAVIAINLTILSVQSLIPVATAQRVDNESRMLMMRLCEKDGGTIHCADVTSDYHLKVQVKDLDRLPGEISNQISGRLLSGLSSQIDRQMTRISIQVSELQAKVDQLGQRR